MLLCIHEHHFAHHEGDDSGLSLINMSIYHAEWREEEMSCIMGYQGLCAFGDWPRLKRNAAFYCTLTSNMEKCSWKALQVRNRTRCSYCKSSGLFFGPSVDQSCSNRVSLNAGKQSVWRARWEKRLVQDAISEPIGNRLTSHSLFKKKKYVDRLRLIFILTSQVADQTINNDWHREEEVLVWYPLNTGYSESPTV